VRRRVLLERTRWHGVTERAERASGAALAALRSLPGGVSRAAGRAVGGSGAARGALVGVGAAAGLWRAYSPGASRAGAGAGWPEAVLVPGSAAVLARDRVPVRAARAAVGLPVRPPASAWPAVDR